MPPRSTSTEVQVQAEPQEGVTRFKRVIIQRPSGNTDSHIHLGFNSFESHFPFGEPVDMPADMVDYLRGQRRPEFHAAESGIPIASYTNLINIMDA